MMPPVHGACVSLQPAGNTFSGDNHAMRHLIATLPADERSLHVVTPPQCAMNSYLWRASARQWARLLSHGRSMRSGLWRPGHLLVHLAGWDTHTVRAPKWLAVLA